MDIDNDIDIVVFVIRRMMRELSVFGERRVLVWGNVLSE